MSRSSKRGRKKNRRLLPVVLVSAAAGSLITLSLFYSPTWFSVEEVATVGTLFHIEEQDPAPDTIFIEVLNGAGVSDLARRAQNYLETRRGDVTFYAPDPPGNAEMMNYDITIVVSHDTSFAAAKKVADAIGLGDSSVVMMLPPGDEEAAVDVTVILGRDRDDPSFFIPYRD